MSPPATGSTKPSTSSRWLSDQPIVPVSALHHAHQSANATLPIHATATAVLNPAIAASVIATSHKSVAEVFAE
jgi:hypothetical protein